MTRKTIQNKIRFYIQYFPFTLHSFLWAALIFISYKLLHRPVKAEEPAPFQPFILLMGKMVLFFGMALILLSVLSAIVCWGYYLYLRYSRNTQLELDFVTERGGDLKQRLFMNAALPGVFRPILGFVKGRLFYDDFRMTDKFSLLSGKRKDKSIWRAAITGKSRLELPDIKEYELRGGFVYFEDMLHLFSFAVPQTLRGHFYQPPVLIDEDDREVAPKKTEQLDVRIDQMRRVEGEHLSYKDFESGDDVRRIVWKVYAKNRDLVVRVPEMFEPYASHLYFYASFHAAVKAKWLGEGYLKEMLNYFKNNVWTVFDTLSKKEWEMRYMPDQQFNVPEHLGGGERAAHIISNSSWHGDQSLSHYFHPRHGAVLCISSLTDPVELARMLEQCDASTVVYFIKLSNTFRHFVAWNWLKRIVFLPPKDRLSRLRTRWVFSPMRYQIQKKEREIEELLNKSAVVSGVL